MSKEIQLLRKQISLSRIFAIALIAVVISVYVLFFYGFYDSKLSPNPESWGQFGDYVGGIMNPLIAYMAFYWLTQSVLLQKEELMETRAALRDSVDSQVKQEQHMVTAARINALSAMLTSHNTVISGYQQDIEFIVNQFNDVDNARDTITTRDGKRILAHDASDEIYQLREAMIAVFHERQEKSLLLEYLLKVGEKYGDDEDQR